MKRLFLIIFLAAVAFTCHAEIIKGRVACGDMGLSNVTVTDGVKFTVTDQQGDYTLSTAEGQKFVYISTPSGYIAPVENGVIKFFKPLKEDVPAYDFQLEAKKSEDMNHGFIAVADPQIWHVKEFALLEKAAEDIRATVESYPELSFHGIGCGDIVSHDHSLYPRYNKVMSHSGIPYYNAMGNHDMQAYGRSFETSQTAFEEIYGPSYYSYNVGKIHYVVLNDNFFIGRDYFYIGYLEEKQLRWLENDLKHVSGGSTVIVSMHIPTTVSDEDLKKFRYDRISITLANHKALYSILKSYKAHIITGHMHTMHNREISDNLYEHVTAALCGAWWQGELCTDGAPRGYGVYLVTGDDVKWYYKPTDYPKDYQMRVYSGADYPEFEGYVVANIWNADNKWDIELLLNGSPVARMKRFEAYDPFARSMYANTEKMDHKWIYPSKSDHFWRANIPAEAGKIEVRAIDRFGNEYRAKPSIDNRSKAE